MSARMLSILPVLLTRLSQGAVPVDGAHWIDVRPCTDQRTLRTGTIARAASTAAVPATPYNTR
jgi:hypothetical protein